MDRVELLPRGETLALLQLAKRGDEAAVEKLVRHNVALVRSIARRYYGRAEQEDLVQIGCLGLLKAIRNFDAGRGGCFSTYAVPMIAGEIKRFLRDDGAVKVSRRLREVYAEIMKYSARFETEHGRGATLCELAEGLMLEPGEIAAALDAARPPLSIEEKTCGDEGETTLGDALSSPGCMEAEAIDRVLLAELLSGLDERERELIMLRFYRGRTQAETGAALGLTQVAVSRMESGIIKRLKEKASAE